MTLKYTAVSLYSSLRKVDINSPQVLAVLNDSLLTDRMWQKGWWMVCDLGNGDRNGCGFLFASHKHSGEC